MLHLAPVTENAIANAPAQARIAVAATPWTALTARDGRQWQVAAGWQAWLLGPDGLRWDAWRRGGEVDVIKAGPHRMVWRVRFLGREIYLKQARCTNWTDWLKWQWRGSPAECELRALRQVSALGVATVAPLACGHTLSRHGQVDCFLITDAIPAAVPLDQFLAQPEDRRWQRWLPIRLAELCAGMHVAGVLHDDLHAGNILLQSAATGDVALRLLDLPKIKLRGPLDWTASRDNLAMLFSGLRRCTPWPLWLRCWQHYRQLRADLELPPDSVAWVELDLAARRHAGRILKRRDRRPLDTNDGFQTWQLADATVHAIKEVRPDALEKLLANPPAGAVATGTAESLAKTWQAAHALRERGLRVARPLCWIRPKANSKRSCQLIYESQPTTLPFAVWLAQPERFVNFPAAAVARAIGTAFGQLHDADCLQGTVAPQGLELHQTARGVAARLLDLSGVELQPPADFSRQLAELARLAATSAKCAACTTANAVRVVRAYLTARRIAWRMWRKHWPALREHYRIDCAALNDWSCPGDSSETYKEVPSSVFNDEPNAPRVPDEASA